MAMGDASRIEIHAADAVKDSWTQISTTAGVGDSTLSLAQKTEWVVGDKTVIAASGFDMNEAEQRTIFAVSADGLIVALDAPLEHNHPGEIRTYDNGLTGEDFQSWDVDMRAEVALLSRNVTIQGDTDSAENGYGGHTMIMDGASMHIVGAELTRMGQDGEVGRYPLHCHMLGDASGQYITNSSIHETFNKGMSIHCTQNTWVENVANYDTIGHTYYFEDGSEFGNVLMNTLGMNTREVEDNYDATIGSDHTEVSTYWVTNPANHLIDNHAAGSDDTGFWIFSQDAVQGTSLASGPYDDYPRARRHRVGGRATCRIPMAMTACGSVRNLTKRTAPRTTNLRCQKRSSCWITPPKAMVAGVSGSVTATATTNRSRLPKAMRVCRCGGQATSRTVCSWAVPPMMMTRWTNMSAGNCTTIRRIFRMSTLKGTRANRTLPLPMAGVSVAASCIALMG